MDAPTWALSPTTNGVYYRASAASTGTAAYTLLQTVAGQYGVGYKVSFTSTGIDNGNTFSIVGHKMGTNPGAVTTEVVTGPNISTTYSANYYDTITSITPSATMAGSISVGYLGTSVALPRTRIKGVYYVGTGTAGSVKVNLNSATGTLLLQVDTPALATFAQHVRFDNGVLIGSSNACSDIGILTLTNVTFSTITCG